MIKKIIYCKGLFPLLLYLSLSLSFIPSLILAEGADTSPTSIEETTHQTEPSSSNNEKNTPDFSADVKKGISTEAVRFGFDKEVTIATRHETQISKAPSIVTAITDEEIKNLGYRTFAEICPAIEPTGNNTSYLQAVIQPFLYHLYGIHQGYETI